MVPLSQPAPKQCFTPLVVFSYRCASTHFREIQLAPSSTGISPLTTAHPLIFQHQSVRTSTSFHRSFILAMVRSLGFGSIGRDQCPIKTCFRFGFKHFTFNQATTYNSPAHSSTGTQSVIFSYLLLLVSLRFHVLFNFYFRVSFHLSLTVLFTIGHFRVFSLMRWSSQIHTRFLVSHATRGYGSRPSGIGPL